jgi:hypothetical protein
VKVPTFGKTAASILFVWIITVRIINAGIYTGYCLSGY